MEVRYSNDGKKIVNNPISASIIPNDLIDPPA